MLSVKLRQPNLHNGQRGSDNGRDSASRWGEHGMEGTALDGGTWILRACGDGGCRCTLQQGVADGMGCKGMHGPSLQTWSALERVSLWHSLATQSQNIDLAGVGLSRWSCWLGTSVLLQICPGHQCSHGSTSAFSSANRELLGCSWQSWGSKAKG